MKKILFSIICILCLTGCTNNNYTESKNSTIPDPEKVEYGSTALSGQFEYVEVDGHTYLFYSAYGRSAMAHSGTCPCNPNSNVVNKRGND